MKRLLSLAMFSATYLLFCRGATSAKKHPEKPVLERYEATVTPVSGPELLSIAIEDFTTDEEVQNLAKDYAKAGADLIESRLGKVKKGYWRLEKGDVLPIRMLQLKKEGGVRRMTIIAEAADDIQGLGASQGFVGHRGYPWAFIQIQVDEQGNGNGIFVPFAKLVFDKQGEPVVKPMSNLDSNFASLHMGNVHSIK